MTQVKFPGWGTINPKTGNKQELLYQFYVDGTDLIFGLLRTTHEKEEPYFSLIFF